MHRLAAADPARPLPILVFLHGTNEARIEHRWMGGGQEGDVRRIAAQLMEAGRIPPMLVAAPSAVLPAAVAVARTSWPAFDLDAFLDATAARLRGVATLDRARVVVAGHLGGGCNKAGGIAAALSASTPRARGARDRHVHGRRHRAPSRARARPRTSSCRGRR